MHLRVYMYTLGLGYIYILEKLISLESRDLLPWLNNDPGLACASRYPGRRRARVCSNPGGCLVPSKHVDVGKYFAVAENDAHNARGAIVRAEGV